MAKYFKNIASYKELKEQYRTLLKENHPDNGGDLEKMQDINVEYDALFKIWKDRAEAKKELDEEEKKETAQSTRKNFYTAWGWEGSRYDSNLTLKEIAKIVRTYVKEKYPTCKFSIRTHYASMCQSLSVDLLKFPERMYKTAEELKANYYKDFTYTGSDGKEHTSQMLSDEIESLWRVLYRNDIFTASSWTGDELLECYEKTVFEEKQNFYGVPTEYFKSVVDDVNAFIASYNYNDSDSMIDYFDVNFYDGKVDTSHCKVVSKTARIKNKTAKVKATTTKKEKAPEQQPEQIESKENTLTYRITRGEDTRDGSTLWLVRVNETLTREQYIKENNAMKARGGYYSKFRHAFIFREDPTEKLTGRKTA